MMERNDNNIAPGDVVSGLESSELVEIQRIARTSRVLILSSVAQLRRNLAHRMGAQVRGWSPVNAATVASRFLAELGPSRPTAVLGTSVAEAGR